MLYNENNYTINLGYLFNQYIREYDISKANINVLFAKGVIDKALYDKLYSVNKISRQIYIGNMIKENHRMYEVLNSGIKEYKRKFFEANNIEDNDIISIKNDAVFVLNKIPQLLKFDNVEFVLKNTYTSFMKLNELEIYYGDSIRSNEIIDVKGIKDDDLSMYHDMFLNIIISFFRNMQKFGSEVALSNLNCMINMYLQRKLPIEYYRRFRASSDYCINGITTAYGVLSLPDTDENKKSLDISYNLHLLRAMHMYASQVLYEQVTRK